MSHKTPAAALLGPLDPPPGGRRGFTLLEMMLVLGIMAIALGMGLPPLLRTLDKEPLRQAVSDVVEGLGHARALAILQGHPTDWELRAQDGLMQVSSSSVSPEVQSEATRMDSAAPSDEAAFSARLHQDVAVTLIEVNLRSCMDQEVVRVRFHPNGTSDDFSIVLEYDAGARLLQLDAVTGQTRMEVIR